MSNGKKVRRWYVVIKWDDGSSEKLTGNDFAPDIKDYIDHFVSEVEQHYNEENHHES